MSPSCVEPLPLYRPRNPQASGLWRVMDRHFATFQRVYDERFEAKYGFWRPIVERSVTAFLRCGDLHEGFARVRCPDCKHEMFVAFSCKQRCTCPSCHQKRVLLTAIHVAEEVCLPVAHRQVVLTIPIAEFTQHIPPKGAHLIRYYGWYSNKARGMRRKAAEAAEQAAATSSGIAAAPSTRSRCSQTWAMLIKRVYEVDPLACPKCGGGMRVIAFIEPPQGAVIEKILQHCGLWHPSSPRPPPEDDDLAYVPDGDWDGQTAFSDEPRELTYVPEMDWESQTTVSDEPWEVYADADTFEATF